MVLKILEPNLENSIRFDLQSDKKAWKYEKPVQFLHSRAQWIPKGENRLNISVYWKIEISQEKS